MHSIRPKSRITAWWATRWLELERLLQRNPMTFFGLSGQDAPGYSDARMGRVLEPAIEGGVIRGTVSPRHEGGIFEPWIVIAPLSAPAIERVISVLSSRVQYLAELLSGQFPIALSAQLREDGIELFPARSGDMKIHCSCRRRPPCPHSGALQYVVADALERDPLLLFELRGMPRDRLLAAVHEHRKKRLEGLRAPSSADETPAHHDPPDVGRPEDPSSAAPLLDALRDSLPATLEPPPVAPGSLGPLAALREPEGWSEDISLAEMLAPVLSAAAQQARNLLIQPGRIRTLAPGGTPDFRSERARNTPPFPHKELLLRALSCVALARRAGRGEELSGVLEEFWTSLARPPARPGSWKPGWVGEVLGSTSRVVVSLLRPELAQGWKVSALVAERPEGPVALTWTSIPGHASAQTVHKAERRLLSELSELVPETVALVLLAEQDEGSEQLQAHLDILGWDYVLRGPSPEASSPELAAQTPDSKAGPGCFQVHDPTVMAEPWVGVDGAMLDRALWLQVLARGALATLGMISPPGLSVPHDADAVERGGLWYDALATTPESSLLPWLHAAAEILGASLWWRSIWGHIPDKNPPKQPR